jgi:hypothetical protein
VAISDQVVVVNIGKCSTKPIEVPTRVPICILPRALHITARFGLRDPNLVFAPPPTRSPAQFPLWRETAGLYTRLTLGGISECLLSHNLPKSKDGVDPANHPRTMRFLCLHGMGVSNEVRSRVNFFLSSWINAETLVCDLTAKTGVRNADWHVSNSLGVFSARQIF